MSARDVQPAVADNPSAFPMLRSKFAPALAAVLVLPLAACRTPRPPTAPRAALAPAPLLAVPTALPPEPALPPGVTLSPPLTGDLAASFSHGRRGERTFPPNLIGANLAFTANLRMPKLEAATLDPETFQLRMRFSNASDEPLNVSLVCIYEGETRAARSIRHVQFPVNTFRDIAFDLDGDVSRKVSIQATAVPATL